MRRLFTSLALVGLAACGGGSNPAGPGPIATPTPAPPQAARAVIVLGHRNNTFTVTSRSQVGRLTLLCGDAHVEYSFAETAGLGATLSQADVYLLEADGDIDDRIVTPGTELSLRLEPHGGVIAESNRFECGYEGRDYPFRFHSTWDWTDDRGNHIQVVGEVGLIEQ